MKIELKMGGLLHLPAEILTEAALQPGDKLDCEVLRGQVVLTPNGFGRLGRFPPTPGVGVWLFWELCPLLEWRDRADLESESGRIAGPAACARRGAGPQDYGGPDPVAGADESHAMDNLYKICGALRRVIRRGIPIPLNIQRDILTLDTREMDSDVRRFEALYQQRRNIACCQEAVALYKGPFLFEEYYEWTAQIEAYYDLRYLELLHIIVRHLSETGDPGAS